LANKIHLIKYKIKDNKRVIFLCFIATFIFGFSAHAFCYFNVNFSHDSLIINQSQDIIHQISIGRFMHSIIIFIRGNTYNPWLIGCFSLIFLSFSAILIVKIFEIRSMYSIISVCLIITTNATISLLNSTYIHTVDIYMISLFLVLLGTYLFKKNYNNYFFLISIPLYVISLAIYQSYIEVGFLIILIIIIKSVYMNIPKKEIGIYAFKYFIIVVASFAIYFAIHKLVILSTKIPESDEYNSIFSFFKRFKTGIPFEMILGVYTSFFKFLRNPQIHLPNLFGYLNLILLALFLLEIMLFIIFKKISIKRKIICIILIIFSPFVFNFIYIISNGIIHELMIFSYYILIVWGISLIEQLIFQDKHDSKQEFLYAKKTSLVCYATYICLFGVCNFIYSNQLYLKKNIEFTKTLNVFNMIVSRIETTENYITNKTPVGFVGKLENGPLAKQADYFNYLGVGQDHTFAVTYYESYQTFINDVLQHPMNIIPKDEAKIYETIPSVMEMTTFPNKSSIKFIDKILIIKFS